MVRTEIMEPVARQMTELGCPFRGILYGGIMITEEGTAGSSSSTAEWVTLRPRLSYPD